MTELEDQVRGALAQITDDWNPARSERNLPGVQRRFRAVRQRRILLGVSTLGLLIGIGWAGWSLQREQVLTRTPTSGPQPTAAAQPRHMQFEDGSQLDLLDPSARIVVDEVTRERVSVRLLSGHARVDVVPRKERAFRVQCGDVTVEVLGTAFEVLREGARTRVSVLRGRVAVHAPGGSSQLSAGEVGWFPKPPAETAPQPEAAEPALAARVASKHRDSGWQAQAERGDYRRAYELMPGSPERVSDDVQELLLAADAARLSGHPAQAVPFLRRVIERHPRDARASLAAFTLGGVLLNQLDRPREAEAAYAHARNLALSPALAQDALARQVEAAQRAGDVQRTRELAREYLRSYPNGRRVQWVKELSGS
jgi:transmembrane sensor